ncbi:MAG: hypothetical protein VZS44_01290 [Bacilli bacterium]|nr:hypothetical protein [Bacilli bacterium]
MEHIEIDYCPNLDKISTDRLLDYKSIKTLGYPTSCLEEESFNKTDLAELTSYDYYMARFIPVFRYGSINEIVYPKLLLPKDILLSLIDEYSDDNIIEFGEYPQTKADPVVGQELEQLYKTASSFYNNSKASAYQKLKLTGHTYTIETTPIIKSEPSDAYYGKYRFQNRESKDRVTKYNEYEYKGNKYIRFVDNRKGKSNEVIWLKVLPIKWEVENGILYSKLGLFNSFLGNEDRNISRYAYEVMNRDVPYYEKDYYYENWWKKKPWSFIEISDYKTSNFLENNFLKDILQSVNLTKVIKYTNFNELKSILNGNKDQAHKDKKKNNTDIMHNIFQQNTKEYDRVKIYDDTKRITKLILDGPELTSSEIKKIKRLISPLIELSFKNGDFSEDIQDLLDKIYNISNNLPDNTKKSITDKVSKLLKQYKKDLKEAKPEFGSSNDFNLGEKDIDLLKPLLLNELELILLQLTSEDKAINYMEKLSNYKKILSTSPKELIKDDSSIYAKINNIIFMINEINNNKESYREELIKYLDDATRGVSKELEKGIDFKPDLSYNNGFDIDKKLDLNISKLYDEVSLSYNKIIPFVKLLNALEKNTNTSSDIIEELNLIEEIVNNLSNNNYKEDINNKFNSIKAKYINMLKNIIGNKDLLNNTKYEKIETKLIKEIQELLIMIKQYNIMDSLKTKKYDKEDLLNQLEESKQIINNKETVKITKDIELKAITSTITEMNNYLYKKIPDKDTRDMIRNLIIKKIDESIEDLNKKEINNLKDYNQELRKILYSLVDVELEMEIYNKRISNYEKHTK